MKVLLLLAALQAPSTLAEVRRLHETGASAEALALTERLLAEPKGLADAESAAIHHARGVILAGSTDGGRLAAVEAFDKARALAGPGDLRLDATYDAAWTWLAEGETLRAKIPEIAGTAPTAAPAAPADPPQPDPLDLAQAAYLQARGRFVDRVRLDARDADTRANLELAQKRLRELEEIRRKREEEKKAQEKPPKDEKEPPKDSGSDDEKKDEQEKDPEPKPDEPPKPDEQKPDEEKKPEEQQPDEPSEPKDPKKDQKPKPSQEELLTREEVMRLLDILKNREEEGKKLQEQLRAARRVAVKRDW